MSNYRSFTTTRIGREQFFTTFPDYLVDDEKLAKTIFFRIQMDFNWSTNMAYMTCSLNAWGIHISAICIPDYGCHLCFASPPQLWVHLRATSGRILMNLFFRRHGHTRILDMSYGSNQICSNIRFQIISSWSDICNFCLAFWTECDGNSSTSFFKIGLYEIKRQESTRLQTF